MEKTKKPKVIFTYDEVQALVQSIYSEFAELPLSGKTTPNLRHIIEIEVEQHPLQPVQIFKKER